MKYPMEFISEENFRKHILNTITHYGDKLKPIDLTKFNSNIRNGNSDKTIKNEDCAV